MAGRLFDRRLSGTPAYVYENPGAGGHDKPWPKHQVFDSVANESPQLTNLVGDERPELVCTRKGFFGYATIDFSRPFEAWKFHTISEKIAPDPFGHGLGVGDVNGDGRLDILMKDGWFAQPEKRRTISRGRYMRPALHRPAERRCMPTTSMAMAMRRHYQPAAHEYGWPGTTIKDGERIAFAST
jgi:hypothetical protein